MNGKIIPTILGKGRRFPGTGPPPTFWSLMVSLGTVLVPVGMSFCLLMCCCAIAQSCPTLWDPRKHARPHYPSPSPRACSKLFPLSQWCHPTISFSVIPFSSCSRSFPTWGSFLMSQLFALGSQSIRASASASVLPMNIQDWFPLGWTGWTTLKSKRLSRIFSNTTVQKHQFFDGQPSLWSNFHIYTWLLEKA